MQLQSNTGTSEHFCMWGINRRDGRGCELNAGFYLYSPSDTICFSLSPLASDWCMPTGLFQTLHVLNLNLPILAFFLCRLMFPHRAPAGSLSSLTADSSPPQPASWAARSIASQLNETSAPGPAVSASGGAEQPLCCLEPAGLCWPALPWIQSPPILAIPITLGAPGDRTDMGKTESCSLIIDLRASGATRRTCGYLALCTQFIAQSQSSSDRFGSLPFTGAEYLNSDLAIFIIFRGICISRHMLLFV